VTLVTHERNRAAIERDGVPDGAEVLFIDTEWFAGPLYRAASRLFPNSQHSVFLISSLDYYLFDWVAIRTLRRRAATADARVIHVVTPVSSAAATRMHRLGRPVILGPLNSGLQTPSGFPEIMRQDSGWLYPLRQVGRVLDRLTGSTDRAAAILVATEATKASLPREVLGRCEHLLENGVDLDLFTAAPWPSPPVDGAPLRVLFAGRLLPFKGVNLLLQAMALMKGQVPIEARIVGSGPMAGPWRALASKLGLENEVSFLGELPLAGIAAEMRRAHVFCLPSIRESGGAVLLEAMASSRPVIAVGYGGPAETVDDQVGVLVPPDGADAVIRGFAAALADVVARPRAWQQLGEAGRRRAESEFSWDAKIERALTLYQQLAPS
jgi:glycosyltransferase involved in cell wall biosynthesis